jgi:hypothetical protein
VRLKELNPLVEEYQRLEPAAVALDGVSTALLMPACALMCWRRSAFIMNASQRARLKA